MEREHTGDEALKRGKWRCKQRLVDFACARDKVKRVRGGRCRGPGLSLVRGDGTGFPS